MIETHTYKKLDDGSELTLDVYYPENWDAGTPLPSIIFFFGGGWNGGTKKHFSPQCKLLQKHGIIGITPEYRTKSSHATAPNAAIEDAKSAIAFVDKKKEAWGLDPKFIALAGGSAGGHLAIGSQICPGFVGGNESSYGTIETKAFVLFNPVIDTGPEGYGYDRISEWFPAFSPMHNICEGIAPTLIMLGTNDHLVPVATAESFKMQMEDKGNTCEVELYKDQQHGFFNQKDEPNPYFELTFQRMLKFLKSQGFPLINP